MKTPSFRDVEQLSALLDGKLSRADSVRLEERLRTDPNLRAIMDDLAEARGLLRRLPARRAPRNFTLTPKMAGIRPPIPRAVPTLRFATALASMLLLFSLATNALVPALSRQAATAPNYGMGGGGAPEAAPEVMSVATEAPLAEPSPGLAQALPTLEPTTSAEDASRAAETRTPDMSLEDTPPEQPAPSAAPPVPVVLEIGLLIVAGVSGLLAWLLYAASERSWRAKKK